MDDHCIDKTKVHGRTTTQGNNTGYDVRAPRWDSWNPRQQPPEVSPFCPSYSYGLRPPAIPTHDILLST
ncbi:hypothetical protein LR48_Vigan187s002600 [Vigna angularis]|uniref:Uncharacterized protein n=1 Tax=Phaseolus angularis TaxID=3914 RepID=A0A0L9T604_PHAAN|nr:hypothetical protein LR48_Vigan187s002600 [Vigna angularis]